MLQYLIRRLIGTALVLFAVSALTFLIFFATPGTDPAAQMAGRNPTPETIAQIRHDFSLDQPLPVRYVTMMRKLVVDRDLISYYNRTQVLPQLTDALPVTLSLVVGGAILWLVAGGLMGVVAALNRGRIIDPILMIIGLVGISMPVFWLGEVFNLLTQKTFHDSLFSWVPELGYTPITQNPTKWFLQLIVPWVTLAIFYAGFYGRVLRSNLIDAENEDFVRTARAKGISERRVLVRHMLRTSLISIVSLFGLDFGALIGGAALLVEVVYGLPGVGYLTAISLKQHDLPTILATVLYGAFFVVFANLVVDLIYAKLDPRVRPS